MAARPLALVGLALLALAASAAAAPNPPTLPGDLGGLLPGQLPAPPVGLPSGPGTDTPAGGHGTFPSPVAPDLVSPSGSWDATWLVAGAAGLAGLAGLAVWGGTRFREEDVLEHDVRAAIYRHVQQHVGASLKEITDALGLSTTNAVWHLRKLEERGLVRGRKSNGAKVYYPTAGGVQARNLSVAGAALMNANARAVLAFIQEHPGVHQREVGRHLNVNHGTVRWHLKKLRNAELLEERRTGGATSYHATPLGVDALRASATRHATQAAALGQVTPQAASQPTPPS